VTGVLDKLDQVKIKEAAAHIAKSLNRDVLLSFLDAIYQDPEEWWVQWHLHGGMGLRNYLREGGFGEEDLGVENLDDVYLPLFYKGLAMAAYQMIEQGNREEDEETRL
jgi:hypothetical protein